MQCDHVIFKDLFSELSSIIIIKRAKICSVKACSVLADKHKGKFAFQGGRLSPVLIECNDSLTNQCPLQL